MDWSPDAYEPSRREDDGNPIWTERSNWMARTARIIAPVTAAVIVASALAAAPGAVAQTGDANIDAWLTGIKERHSGKSINMLMASQPSTTAYQEIIEPFEAATGVTVNIDPLEEGAMLEKQVLECQRGSDDYDVWMTAVEGVSFFADAGCEVALDDRIAGVPAFYDFADLVPAYSDLFNVGGSQYAIPFAGETVFLMYRKDVFEERGYVVPTTWDELAILAENIKAEGTMDGVVFRARKGWEFTYTYSIFLFPSGGQMFDAGTTTPNIDMDGSRAALDYMIRLKESGPLGIESFSFPEAWQAFQTGTVAMAVEASASAPEMENAETSLVAGNVGYAPLPAGPAGAFSGVWGWRLGGNSKSTEQDLAWDVSAWLTGKQSQAAYLAAGGIPSRTSAFADPALQEKYPFFPATLQALDQAAALAATGQTVVAKIPEWNEVSNVIGDYGSQAFAGQISSADALARMQADISELMTK